MKASRFIIELQRLMKATEADPEVVVASDVWPEYEEATVTVQRCDRKGLDGKSEPVIYVS